MSGWNGTDVVRYPPRTADGYPGWVFGDCGCCNGIQWGGEEPRECDLCWATGWRCIHIPSRSIAVYPGGPFLGGHADDYELDEARKATA